MDLADRLFALLAVSSAYLAVLGAALWLVLRFTGLGGRAAGRSCAVLLAVPVLTAGQWLVPRAAPPGPAAPPLAAEVAGTDGDRPVDPIVPAAALELSGEVAGSAAHGPEPSSAAEPARDPASWRPALLGVWGALAACFLARELGGLRRRNRVLGRAREVADPALRDAFAELAAAAGLRRTPRLVASAGTDVPLAVGGGAGTVVLPEGYAVGDPRALQFTLLHELEHLRRRDARWLPLFGLVRSLYFFHPAVHWAVRRIREEREALCDEAVVRLTGDRAGYAEFLLGTLGGARPRPQAAYALGLLSSPSAAFRRIRRVLAPGRSGPPDGLAPASALAACVVLLVLGPGLRPLAAAAPAAEPQEPPPQDPVAAEPPAPRPDGGLVRMERPRGEAIAAGLAYLTRLQRTDGSWRAAVGYKLNQGYQVTGRERPHVGVTALAGLAFLQAGGGAERSDAVWAATEFLLSVQDRRGYLASDGTRMYGHGFALRFLAERQRLRPDERVLAALRAAVELSVSCQNDDGSWSYYVTGDHSIPEAALQTRGDLSVTCCVLRALQSAALAGIEVPAETLGRALGYVQACRVTGEASLPRTGYTYQASQHARSSYPLTAWALASLLASGAAPEEHRPELAILSSPEEGGELDAMIRSFGDHYLGYHGFLAAAEAVRRAGDGGAADFWGRVTPLLLGSQLADGSWPSEVGPGAAYSTAVAVILLAQAPL